MKKKILLLTMAAVAAMSVMAQTYYVAGNGTLGNSWCDGKDWVPNGSQMSVENPASITFNGVPAGAYEFKVTNGQWSGEGGQDWGWNDLADVSKVSCVDIGDGDNIRFTISGTADITITFDGTNITLSSSIGFAPLCVPVSQGNPLANTICYNTSTPINLAAATGGNAGNVYLWQQSIDNFSWTNAQGTNNGQNYTTPNLTSNMYYRRQVTNGCDASVVTSNSALITVSPLLQTTTPQSQTICYGSIPATLSVAASGGDGSYTYQWQQRANGSSGWDNVSNGTGGTTANYTSPALTATNYYRCNVTSGSGCGSVSSNVVTITVLGHLQVANQSGNQAICYNNVPQTLAVTANGGTNLTYQWQQSSNGSTGWANVTSGTGGTTANYTPPALTTTTYYRCMINSANGCGSVVSNNIAVTVYGQLQVSAPASQTICYNSVPQTLIVTATGGTNLSYQWQQSANGSSGWNDVTNGTSGTTANYTPPALAATTYYRCMITSANSCGSNTSGIATITVRPQFSAGTINSNGQMVCLNGTATQIGSATNASGGDENISYRWKRNGDVIVPEISSPTYTPPTDVAGTFDYIREAKDGTCNTTWAASANSWRLIVYPAFTAGAITSGSQSICSGDPATITIGNTIAASGGNGAITYEWYKNGVAISNSNNAAYAIPAADKINTGTANIVIEYTRKGKDATCQTTFASSTNSYTFTVYPALPDVSFIQAPNPVCSNQKELIYEVTLLNGATYQWFVDKGTSSGTGNSVLVNWNEAGEGKITAKVTNSNGCATEISQFVTISPNSAPELNDIVAKYNDNVPYMLIYPNPSSNFTYQWYKNDNLIVGATEQFFYPQNYGQTLDNTAEYKVYVAEIGINSTACGNYTNVFDFSAQSNAPQKDKYFTISPNPINIGEYFVVSFNKHLLQDAENCVLSIYSLIGEKIWEQKVNSFEDITISKTMTAGVYTITLVSNKGQHNEKIVIK